MPLQRLGAPSKKSWSTNVTPAAALAAVSRSFKRSRSATMSCFKVHEVLRCRGHIGVGIRLRYEDACQQRDKAKEQVKLQKQQLIQMQRVTVLVAELEAEKDWLEKQLLVKSNPLVI